MYIHCSEKDHKFKCLQFHDNCWWRSSDMIKCSRATTKWTLRQDCFLNYVYLDFIYISLKYQIYSNMIILIVKIIIITTLKRLLVSRLSNRYFSIKIMSTTFLFCTYMWQKWIKWLHYKAGASQCFSIGITCTVWENGG